MSARRNDQVSLNELERILIRHLADDCRSLVIDMGVRRYLVKSHMIVRYDTLPARVIYSVWGWVGRSVFSRAPRFRNCLLCRNVVLTLASTPRSVVQRSALPP